ncbi:MAG: hypothetical protein SGILL_001653, partial [Bacillariaceae sp.]
SATDPMEILRASVEFEKTHHIDDTGDGGNNIDMANDEAKSDRDDGGRYYVQNSRHSIVPPLPPPARFKNSPISSSRTSSRSSSSRSLYPSLECVSRTASDFDSNQVEQSWQKAAAVSKQKKRQCPLPSSPLSSSIDRGNERGYPLSYSGFNGFDGSAFSPETGTMGVTRALSQSTRSSSLGSLVVPATAPVASLGMVDRSTASESRDLLRDYQAQGVAYIPSERSNNEEDDDMITLKMAAYGCGPCTGTSMPEDATAVPDTATDRAAEATVVEYGMIHPLEEEAVVEAEFVCQSQYETQDFGGQSQNSGYDALTQPMPLSQQLDLTQDVGGDNFATEATVIASGPADKATEAAWSAADTMEATVLQAEERVASLGSIDDMDMDKKPPALPVIRDSDIGVIPVEQGNVVADVLGTDQEAHLVVDEQNSAGAVATVVDYNVHPSEMTSSVQAEFLGNSQTEIGAEQVSQAVEGQFSSQAEHFVEMDVTEAADTTEATVVDSGPIDKATAEAWSTGIAEEAQVLGEDPNSVTVLSEQEVFDRSVSPAVAVFNSSHGDDVAEIVAINEQVHPSELTSDTNTATAELIGDDLNVAVATTPVALQSAVATSVDISSDQPVVTLNGSVHAVAVEECETTSPILATPVAAQGEAEATLVNDDGVTAPTRVVFAHQTSSESTVQDPSQPADEADLQPVTAVVVLDVEDHAVTEDDFYDYPQKPSKAATRGQTETRRPCDEEDTQSTEQENTPLEELNSVVPIPPPMALASRYRN